MFTPTEEYAKVSNGLFLFLINEKLERGELIAYSLQDSNEVIIKIKDGQPIAVIDTDPALEENPRCFLKTNAYVPFKD